MNRMGTNASREMVMLAGRVREQCTNLMLDWGAAMNAAEAKKDDAALRKKAQDLGLDVATFAAAIATVLHR